MKRKSKRPKNVYILKTGFWDAYEEQEPRYSSHICYSVIYASKSLAEKTLLDIYENKYKQFEGAKVEIFKDKNEHPLQIVAQWSNDGVHIHRRYSHSILSIPLVSTKKEFEEYSCKILF